MPTPKETLHAFSATQDYLVCIDSDGCAFDTMGIKQRECFCPWMIQAFNLQPVAEAARECKEFADLFSKTRGANRHVTIKRILTEVLPSHPKVRSRGFVVPQYPAYFAWIDNPDSLLSNEGLAAAITAESDPIAKQELESILEWSERVNWAVGEIVKGIPPFPGVRESLQRIQGQADVVVVSATPLEALLREWAEHNIKSYTALICGQEMGTKQAHIAVLGEPYPREHILMVGDAPGDLRSAQANDVLFFPIIPGEEEESWKEFIRQGLDRFFAGTYRGAYEQKLLEQFDCALPESPAWEGQE
ncbi:HAD family hydrolase [Candidatus Bipolaricaulota bacterium]|nr:HAD family hydrolase [Candidatus Bipolaricaulota bacterium]